MAGIFVSYRRDDSQGFAGRLADDLSQLLGEDRVFRDIEIPLGTDFTDVLQRAIAASDILLVIIGKHWTGLSASGHRSRLFEDTDWVRIEIEAALMQGKQVIPVLVGGARMPSPNDLPASIRQISKLQAATLDDRQWDNGVDALYKRLCALNPLLKADKAQQAFSDSPAEVLRDLSEQLLGQAVSRHRALQARKPTTFTQRLVSSIGKRLRRFISIVLVLTFFYVGIRLFGDQTWLDHLDTLETRLHVGWERLQHLFQ